MLRGRGRACEEVESGDMERWREAVCRGGSRQCYDSRGGDSKM